MRQIEQITSDSDFNLTVKFTNGKMRLIDFKSFFDMEVFKPLSNLSVFQSVKNKGYFIEWEGLEIDMSADTLWHEGRAL